MFVSGFRWISEPEGLNICSYDSLLSLRSSVRPFILQNLQKNTANNYNAYEKLKQQSPIRACSIGVPAEVEGLGEVRRRKIGSRSVPAVPVRCPLGARAVVLWHAAEKVVPARCPQCPLGARSVPVPWCPVPWCPVPWCPVPWCPCHGALCFGALCPGVLCPGALCLGALRPGALCLSALCFGAL